ncbi:MAG TPA: Ppx/GppA family phosphatase, partial [Rhodospirillales bacterium]|nr:Ppx/GppA family phosphatase [Rhodospirillales bacterium]
STELMWVERLPGRKPVSLATLSIPLGVVALAERFGCNAIAAKDMRKIIGIMDRYLAPFDEDNAIGGDVAKGGVQMLGTSGTMTTLGGVYLDLPRYDRSKVDGLEMDFESVIAISARLSAMDCKARAALPCIGRSRADLVAAGCAILNAIHKRWPVKKLCAADRGIREGLLMGLMADDGHHLAKKQ